MIHRSPRLPGPAPASPARRRFVQGLCLGGAALATGTLRIPAHARDGARPGNTLSGTDVQLDVGATTVDFTGRTRPAITVNNALPGPLLRWREGDTVTLRVANHLSRGLQTSIHWHGILLPANMDGVPGMSFNGIMPGESYLYRFTLRQSGTYWYHGHSLQQEQAGLYGAIIVDPREAAPYHWDREHVVLLSDWADLDPGALFLRLKKSPHYDNWYKPTVADFFRDARRDGLAATLADRKAWGDMRMTPTDLSDVNAHTYTYLMNGVTPANNWTGEFRPGEKVLLRFINAGAMTHFDVRIPGLKMTVVAADGQYIHPVSVDEFRIGAAETYDVIVEPSGQDAFTIFAQDMARTGYARGTLAVRAGLAAPVPTLEARPLLTMDDMGHGGHGAPARPMEGGCGAHMGMEGGCGAAMHAPAPHDAHAGHDASGGMQSHPASETRNPLVDMQTMMPAPKLDDPGFGLRDNGRRVLAYADLRSLFEDPDGRDPGRTIELHLTGHMEKFAWSFDGIPFASAEPLRFNYGERLRIVLVNDTMMQHPIHLHGMWSDLEDANGQFMVRKHTVDMPPGTKRSYRVRADALGRWAFHCHLLYHMDAGMMREVRVEERA